MDNLYSAYYLSVGKYSSPTECSVNCFLALASAENINGAQCLGQRTNRKRR